MVRGCLMSRQKADNTALAFGATPAASLVLRLFLALELEEHRGLLGDKVGAENLVVPEIALADTLCDGVRGIEIVQQGGLNLGVHIGFLHSYKVHVPLAVTVPDAAVQ